MFLLGKWRKTISSTININTILYRFKSKDDMYWILLQTNRLSTLLDLRFIGYPKHCNYFTFCQLIQLNVNTCKIYSMESLRSAVINDLHPATTYHIRMLAINEIEASIFTDPLTVKTQEEGEIYRREQSFLALRETFSGGSRNLLDTDSGTSSLG